MVRGRGTTSVETVLADSTNERKPPSPDGVGWTQRLGRGRGLEAAAPTAGCRVDPSEGNGGQKIRRDARPPGRRRNSRRTSSKNSGRTKSCTGRTPRPRCTTRGASTSATWRRGAASANSASRATGRPYGRRPSSRRSARSASCPPRTSISSSWSTRSNRSSAAKSTGSRPTRAARACTSTITRRRDASDAVLPAQVLFRHWTDEKRYEFAQSMRIFRCAKGRYICSRGDACAGLWFLISGELRLQTHVDRAPPDVAGGAAPERRLLVRWFKRRLQDENSTPQK